MTTNKSLRANDLAKIHMAKKDLAMDDATYRAMLRRTTGYDSTARLNACERIKVLAEMQRLGWQPKPSGPHRASSNMLIAMWLVLYQQGKVRNRDTTALLAWASKTTGRTDLKTLDWLTAEQVTACKNGLKQWLKREVEQ